jgi:hypothetical protein
VNYNDENDYTITRRDRWDAQILRKPFDSYIRGSSDTRADIVVTEGSDEWNDSERKRTFDDSIGNLTDNWRGARARLVELQNATADN